MIQRPRTMAIEQGIVVDALGKIWLSSESRAKGIGLANGIGHETL
jgi:hypothetical protein